MKKIVLSAFLLVLSVVAFAQKDVNLDFKLKVLDTKGNGLPNTEVSFVERATKKVVKVKTSADGTCQTILTGKEGNTWQINILKVKNYWKWEFEMLPNGGMKNLTVTYNYDRYEIETRPKPNRATIQFEHIRQNMTTAPPPTKTETTLMIAVKKADKSALSGYDVSLVSYDLAKIYTNKTNEKGEAHFVVPASQEFWIDIDEVQHLDYVKSASQNYGSAWLNITYEPTKINETNSNDTITQQLPNDLKKGTSSRVLVTLKVVKAGQEIWQNESFFLAEIGGKNIYKGISDQNGEIKYLLPKGRKYMIHGKYERDIDVFDLSRSIGIGYAQKTIIYRPDPRYQYPERYIPTPDRLYLKDFQEFFTKQYPLPQNGETFATYAKFGSQINANSKQAILSLGFAVEEAKRVANNGKPINLAIVADISGSMSGYGRIEYLQKGLTTLVNSLYEDDILSITLFESGAEVLFEAQKIKGKKQELLAEIKRLSTAGSTNISEGLEKGYKEALKHYKAQNPNHLLILTDGYGDNPPQEILDISKKYNQKGIPCSAVGVGQDYNYALLKQLASTGGGLIELVDSASGIEKVFAKNIGAVLYPIAEDIKVEVLYNKSLLFAQLYGYQLDERRDGKVVLRLPNMYSGSATNLSMLKFTLVNPTQSMENEPVTIKTTFYDVRKKTKITKEEKIYLSWSAATGVIEYLQDREEKKLYAIAVMNQCLKVMADSFAGGDVVVAKRVLDDTLKEIKEIFPKIEDQDLQKLMSELESYLDILGKL